MRTDKNQSIEIIKISPSPKEDRSPYYFIDIYLAIGKKEYTHSEYLDPVTNKIVIKPIRPSKGIMGNQRTSILSEIGVRLNLTDDDAKDKLLELLQKANDLIENSTTPNYRNLFPPFSDVLQHAIESGFILLKLKPDYHFMQTLVTPKGDMELHICTPSIEEVLGELEEFEKSGFVSSTYSYRSVVQRCAWQSDFFISVNQEGNGWYLHCKGNEAWEKRSGRYNSLRELYFAVLNCKQELAIGP
jgi:hypothetical protein